MDVAVLMACHNRRSSTLACLEALHRQAGLPEDFHSRVYLLDDGSIDGTGDAVRAAYPSVQLLQGDGRCYWAGGMRRAWLQAEESNPDCYFWLNDDTFLDPQAFAAFLRCRALVESPGAAGILVGSTRDPVTGHLTYGGFRRGRGLFPFRMARVAPGPEPARCDTFNGNSIWIPREVARELGGFSGAFTHGFADFDYGFRAGKHGVLCWVLPGTVGTCASNPHRNPWLDPELPLRRRWVQMMDRKGLPFRDWGIYCLRHGGVLAPALWVFPYLRMVGQHVLHRLGFRVNRRPARHP